ncbi:MULTISPECIES: dethiobiotin synthase [unclassified Arthrobacter]|uniref:dethiobiotin synthase n=1 Tax=unclassified Arthrobacter TaxID=235627 RepID=UPI00159E5A3A|nr:dethiobiotin synthase [Arthrobacter sp. STN4]MCQ9165829.1 dethiobiotin synthase [Arthrobacter sp. STN4]NVM99734.1 ATP-dependent dethiobiotin synthetase BioD [Arthrobacter sp. SDTb3-6]
MKPAAITFVTGTDTDVGKTVTTAALAAAHRAVGATVAVYKPTQTGVAPDGAGDMAEVSRLSGVRAVHEGIRLRDPMAPVAAAVREGRGLPALAQHVDRIAGLAGAFDHVLVEGAGGLLVELDANGNTLAELAVAAGRAFRCSTVVVCRSGLGTLNHTLLTLEALERRGLPAAGLVVGSWPRTPSDLEEDNRSYFRQLATPYLGALPAGAAGLAPHTFQERAPRWLRLPAGPGPGATARSSS